MTEKQNSPWTRALSRRKAFGAVSAGALAGALVSSGRTSLAQTPATTGQVERIGHLFILVATDGILQPGANGIFELILRDVGQRVLYFSDPPEQQSDFVEIDAAFSQIALDAAHCNAGLTVSTDEQQNVSLALELRSASYDPATQSATFAVHLLNGFHPTNWKDGFRAPTLVIDDTLPNPDN